MAKTPGNSPWKSDEEHAAEDPERLDADQPMLRDAADDRAERSREKKEVASGKRCQQRNGDAGGIGAEDAVGGQQHDADEPDSQHGCRSDGPAHPARSFAREGADADVKADPIQR
jgi:hypothetical protein